MLLSGIQTLCVVIINYLQLHIDSSTPGDPTSPEVKDHDFFKEHVEAVVEETPVNEGSSLSHPVTKPVPIANGKTNGSDEGINCVM